jgi:hypothetical protein
MTPGVASSAAAPYRVELTGAAWRQVGGLPREEFARLEALLSVLALQLAHRAWGGREDGREGPRGFLEVPCGTRIATCELLHAERTVRLVHLTTPAAALRADG